MKSVVSLLLAFGVIAPAAAFASVDAVSVSVAPNPAETGQQVTVSVEAQKSGSGCNNNWGYTKVFADGVQIGTTTLNSFTGSGTTTDSFTHTFNTAGDVLIAVEAWSGAEDFSPQDGNPDCSDTLLGSDDVTLKVKNPEPKSSSKSSSSVSGGGGFTYCDLDTQPTSQLRDIAMCLDRSGKVVNALQWRAAQSGDSSAIVALKIQLMTRAVSLLNQMIELVKGGATL